MVSPDSSANRAASDRAPDFAELLPQVEGIARQAGALILRVYHRDFEVRHKDDRSPLTEADLASHRHIVAALRQLTPDLPVLSEEAVEDFPYPVRQGWRRFWLVDPLDGTKEFVKRNGEFTVNIALVDDGAVVLGVVHAPALELSYAASIGSGAMRGRAGGSAERIGVRGAKLTEPLRVVASRSHAGPETERFLAALERERPLEVVSQGSALKICLVADGSAQLYPRLGPTMEWDTAAAQCVVEQAGGRLVDLAGEAFRYNRESLLNPSFLVCAEDPAPYLRLLAES